MPDPEQVVTLPRDVFQIDGKFDEETVKPGAVLPMMTADGFRISGIVKEVTDTDVKMDFNHPSQAPTCASRAPSSPCATPPPRSWLPPTAAAAVAATTTAATTTAAAAMATAAATAAAATDPPPKTDINAVAARKNALQRHFFHLRRR